VHGGWTIAARPCRRRPGAAAPDAGVHHGPRPQRGAALRAGAAAVLDSRIPPLEKLGVAQDVLAIVRASNREVPDVRGAFADRPDTPEYLGLEDALVAQLDRAVTAAFSRPFLLARAARAAALVRSSSRAGR
jgi:hypothetical protein